MTVRMSDKRGRLGGREIGDWAKGRRAQAEEERRTSGQNEEKGRMVGERFQTPTHHQPKK